jgi:hypothetical protein
MYLVNEGLYNFTKHGPIYGKLQTYRPEAITYFVISVDHVQYLSDEEFQKLGTVVL